MIKTNKTPFSRRDFLRIVAMGGIAGVTASLGFRAATQDRSQSETRLLMGTLVNLTVISNNAASAKNAIESCFSRMELLEHVLSRHNPDSQLSQLNSDGTLLNPHPALTDIIQQSLALHAKTDGAFDITIKPLLDRYLAHEDLGLPECDEIETLLSLVDSTRIQSNGKTLSFEQPGMEITLDGIGKGFIVDEGARVLEELGFANILVEAGGDLQAAGMNLDQDSWELGIQNPRGEIGDLLERVALRNRAVATSGDYHLPFIKDRSLHHILDPRTGFSAPHLAGVMVSAPTCAFADGIATALMVMGPLEGLELVETLPNVEALLVTKTIERIKSSGFENPS